MASTKKTVAPRASGAKAAPRSRAGAAKTAARSIDVDTVARVRVLLAGRRGVSETFLMGKVAFLLDGALCCTIGADGMLIRVRAEERDEMLAKTGASPMIMGKRTMKGFVRIEPSAYRTAASLARWVERGVRAAAGAKRA